MTRALLLLLALGSSTSAEPRYYMVVFGSQSWPNLPRNSHVWASFVKADGEQLEIQHISWLPKSMNVEPVPIPEPGVNLDLGKSKWWAHSRGASIVARGPYRISAELYDMAVKQRKRLESGELQYVCVDNLHRGRGATNCIHAVSDLDTTQPPLWTGRARGWLASSLVVNHFRKHVVDTDEDMGWLSDRLGLER